jgi:hypothetical protein
MKTVTVRVFEIDELIESAAEVAYENWRDDEANRGNPYGGENYDSWKGFTLSLPPVIVWDDRFNRFIVNDDDWYNSYGDKKEFTLNAMRGLRLRTWLINNLIWRFEKGKFYSTRGTYDINGKYTYKSRHSKIQMEITCPFTGYCMDDECILPILNFIKEPNERDSLEDILNDCRASWIAAVEADDKYRISEEAFREDCDANKYQFLSNGKMFERAL